MQMAKIISNLVSSCEKTSRHWYFFWDWVDKTWGFNGIWYGNTIGRYIQHLYYPSLPPWTKCRFASGYTFDFVSAMGLKTLCEWMDEFWQKQWGCEWTSIGQLFWCSPEYQSFDSYPAVLPFTQILSIAMCSLLLLFPVDPYPNLAEIRHV